jgi:hypothetical protein
MKYTATMQAHADRATAALRRADAAEYAAAEIAAFGRPHSATDAVWHEISAAETRGVSPDAWARKRRAVFRGILRSFKNRLGWRD